MFRRSVFHVLAIFTFLFMLCAPALAQEGVLYRFLAGPDGEEPRAGLIADAAGNLYGTTFYGGGQSDVGTVFRLTPPHTLGGAWTETVLHSFSDLAEGWDPWAGLVADAAGNLYGTTWLGGAEGDCGVVFELSPMGSTWNYSVIHNFTCDDNSDGGDPRADLAIDGQGNLYGTTSVGGTGLCFGGCGVVFELSPSNGSWTETVLYNFPAIGSGDDATGGTGGGVVLDNQGNLYGTTFVGGGSNATGAVFVLKRPAQQGGQWTYHVLHAFVDPTQGIYPEAGVIFDRQGNLYGTTELGAGTGCYGSGCGVVFELSRQGGALQYNVLYTFTGQGDGGLPQASLTLDKAGNLYGTTQNGGTGTGCSGLGCGVAFRLAHPAQPGAPWTQSVLHTFRGASDGYVPWGKLAIGKLGLLYGATQFGGITSCDSGFGCGTVFVLRP